MGLWERVRGYRRAGEMALWTAAMLPAAQLHSALKKQPRARLRTFQAWEQVWAERLLAVFGMRLHLVGQAPAGPPPARLVVCNHRSPVDILVALAKVGGSVLSRADLARWPLLGPAAIAAGTIFVERGDRRSGAKAVREIRRRLAEGQHVVVFPEGTTFAGDEVRPFHRGGFSAAIGLPIEILPMAVAYPPGCEFIEDGFGEHLLRVAGRRRTDVGVALGAPYRTTSSPQVAAEEARVIVQELVQKARAAIVSGENHMQGVPTCHPS